MTETLWRVGQLSRRTGLSVRTLHHYDDLGLLTPAQRSDAGYRLYGEGDVARLQDLPYLRLDHIAGQPVFRDAQIQHASRNRGGFEDGY